ncbi:MAG: serine hydrolase domain-containing protein [Gemmatimonadales bacterium]
MIVGLLIALPGALAAQDRAPALDTARIDSIVAAGMTARRLVGLSVGIMEDGRIVFVKGYGTANLANHARVDTTTRFAIGSVTKQFTSAIVLQLAAEGKLSVDDPVAKYLPDLTRAGDIRLRDLMGHVSGYPDYYPLDFVDRRMLVPISADSLARWYGHQPLDFEPGTRWSYSNTGFIILGRIAELVTHRPYPRLLRERIFAPLGMRHTAYEPARRDASYAQGYAWFGLGDPEPALPEAPGWAAAAGGIWSTPSDLLIWDRALLAGRVVPVEFLHMMTSARQLVNGASTNYGFGLSIGVFNGDTIYSHGGAVSGFAAQNTMVPRTRSAVVVLSNAEASVTSGPLVRMAISSRPPPPVRDSSRPAPAANATADPRPVPAVRGPNATDQATTLFRQVQAGQVDRSLLGEEFSWWLNDERVRRAAEHLAPLGEPTRVERLSRAERGGLEVTVTRFTFPARAITALMYRSPDGKVQEFLIREQ